MAKRYDIEKDTALMPDVVAETVIEEVERYLGIVLPQRAEAISHLVETTTAVYQANASWRAKVRRGSSGRDTLYVFMRHWLASWANRNHPAVRRQLPASFANGHAPG